MTMDRCIYCGQYNPDELLGWFGICPMCMFNIELGYLDPEHPSFPPQEEDPRGVAKDSGMGS